jgi:hypothetical protein
MSTSSSSTTLLGYTYCDNAQLPILRNIGGPCNACLYVRSTTSRYRYQFVRHLPYFGSRGFYLVCFTWQSLSTGRKDNAQSIDINFVSAITWMDSRNERNVTELLIQHPLQLIANARHADISSRQRFLSRTTGTICAGDHLRKLFLKGRCRAASHNATSTRPPAYFGRLCTPLLIQLLYLHMRTRGVV